MTFEELKVRIKDNSNVVLRANKEFIKKQYNIQHDINCDNIILIANLDLSESYHRNHVKIEEVIVGGCTFLRENNKNMSSDDAIIIAHARGNDDGRGIAVLFLHNDEDCSGIEVLNVCELQDCGL